MERRLELKARRGDGAGMWGAHRTQNHGLYEHMKDFISAILCKISILRLSI